MKLERRTARQLVLITLYAHEINGNPIEENITNALNYIEINSSGKNFYKELFNAAIDNLDQIDNIIKENSLNWEFDRIAKVDKNILRLALAEFLFFEEIEPAVSIDEAIELAKIYGSTDSTRYINGILDAILHKYIKKHTKKSLGNRS